ncbi:uncharacterized protein C8R40DRAFT_998836, partial [Lentinula edodes]|uniref:uncharacterized protein n=1 Tax=Lentinula edodes TaxID=5353 RepID=UPI001E8DF8EF
GASGSLRKEFRELELLDEISRLRFEGKLGETVHGTTRTVLIESFLALKSKTYMPGNLHSAIRWSDKDPYVPESLSYIGWTVIDKKNWKNLMQNQDQQSTNIPAKSKACNNKASLKYGSNPDNNTVQKDNNTCNLRDSIQRPLQLVWSNNSCAFDSIFTIIRHIW